MTKTCTLAHFTDLHWRQALAGTAAVARRQSRLMPDVFADALVKLDKQTVDLIVLTGDLVDVPLPFGSADRDMVIADYRAVKALLDARGIPYLVLPGNHDDPDCFFTVFERVETMLMHGYELHCFFDQQVGAEPILRTGDELARFAAVIAEPGARNQIHLQHYVIHPEKNDEFPHTYAHAGALQNSIAASERVLLNLSGHYHPGAALEQLGQCGYVTGQAFAEAPYPYALIQLHGEAVQVTQADMSAQIEASPLSSPYRAANAVDGAAWYHGNLHMHCEENSPCSSVALTDGVQQYQDRKKHQFFAVTDHDTITSVAALRAAFPEQVFFEGFETA